MRHAGGTREHLDAVLGDQPGWLFIGVGTDLHATTTGKAEHGCWAERSFRWPAQVDDVISHVVEATAAGADVYYTPALSGNPMRKEARRKKLPVATLWADLDDDPDLVRLDELQARGGVYLAASGSGADRRHLYVPLVEPAAPDVAEDLLRRLAAWLRADLAPGWHGGYLRPAGTLNFKPEVLRGNAPGVVKLLDGPCDPVWTVAELDDLLPPVEHSSPVAEVPDAEPVDMLPAELRQVLDEKVAVGMDRSKRTMAAVGACVRAGLSDGQVISAMRGHAPTVEKYDGRADGEVARVLSKVRTEVHAETPTTGGPVDGVIALDLVAAFLSTYIAFPSPSALTAVTLWVAHCHMVAEFESSPRLALLSPEPGSGKTRVLEVVELLVPRPQHILNASVAAVFRMIGVSRPTLLYDEVDALFGRKGKDDGAEDLRGLLNAGHRRTATIPRCVGPAHKVEHFPVYAASALAGLGDLPDTLMSRSVVVRMRRRAPHERIEPLRRRITEPKGHELRDYLAGWAGLVAQACGDAWPEMPLGITDRPADVWEPLLAIADAAGGHWPKLAREACVELNRVRADTQTIGVKLLDDIRTVFGDDDRLATVTLLERLVAIDESPWGDWYGKPIDSRWLAKHLKPYGITPTQIREGDSKFRGYRAGDFTDAWSRYLETSGTSEAAGTSQVTPTRDVPDVPAVPLIPGSDGNVPDPDDDHVCRFAAGTFLCINDPCFNPNCKTRGM